MAVGCTHGNRADESRLAEVLKFAKKFKPHYRFHLGDVVDTAAFRRGAAGTPDEADDPIDDTGAGLQFLNEYEPTHVAWGNHDWRLHAMRDDPKAIVAAAATTLWNLLVDTVTKLKAKTVPYDVKAGWFDVGGYKWGHGYWYNVSALRDTAEYVGGPVVMAHLHRAQQVQGRTLRYSPSFCVGTLAAWENMAYAHHRRASAEWSHGVVFGEACEEESRLWLASSEMGQPLQFPPGMA